MATVDLCAHQVPLTGCPICNRPQQRGWSCPNCGKAHAPHVKTCPVDNRSLGERIKEIHNG